MQILLMLLVIVTLSPQAANNTTSGLVNENRNISSLTRLSDVEHMIGMSVYQTGGSALGLLYTPQTGAPEPGSFILLGMGLLTFSAVLRRRERKLKAQGV